MSLSGLSKWESGCPPRPSWSWGTAPADGTHADFAPKLREDAQMSNALLHPFADPAKPEADYINIVRAEGSTLWDDNGKTYLDALGSLWYCQVGHGRKDMRDAITAQLDTVGSYNTFDPFTNGPSVRVAELIAKYSPMPDSRVFLGCSGSEAVDTALKLVRAVQRLRGSPHRQIVVRRTHGYHGTNFGGTSAQGIEANREGWGDLVPHFL